MIVGNKIKLISYEGELKGPADVWDDEDYWKLIGRSGTIVKPENSRSRVLVQFDDSVKDLGLHCYNPVHNSIWLLTSDVKMMQ